MGAVEQVDPAGRLPAGLTGDGQGREAGGLGHADLGVGGGGATLGGGDVRAALQDRRRHADRNLGWARDLGGRQVEGRRRLPDQGGDGVLVERALGGDVAQLGLGGRQLGLGTADVQTGGRAAVVAIWVRSSAR